MILIRVITEIILMFRVYFTKQPLVKTEFVIHFVFGFCINIALIWLCTRFIKGSRIFWTPFVIYEIVMNFMSQIFIFESYYHWSIREQVFLNLSRNNSIHMTANKHVSHVQNESEVDKKELLLDLKD
jgi:hypothetical protein